MRHPSYILVFLLLHVFAFHSSVHAADKIRIGFADVTPGFVSLPLAQKRGFFTEEGSNPKIESVW